MIDPDIAAVQRQAVSRLAANAPTKPPANGKEGKCAGCGRRSRDRTGRCRWCRASPRLPSLRGSSVATLRQLMAACAEELRRRQQEIEDALKETP